MPPGLREERLWMPQDRLPVPQAGRKNLKNETGENRMNRMSAPLYLATMILPMAAIAGRPMGPCSTGRLLDVQVDTQVIQAGTTEHGTEREKKNGKREYST